tara:strand:- start:234 stop:2396 length:2163 start_codon:yes stop_codon:yes gene_type:complete
MSERVDKASLPLNQPRRTPSHPTKSHIVKTKVDGKEKILRFGEQGASTAGKPKAGESERMKAKRASFKARHAKNIAKGRSSPAYWANKVKWAEGGAVSLDSLAAKYDDGGSVDPSMLRRLKNTLGSAASDVNRSFYENVSGPAVGSLVDMTVGLGDLAQMGARYLGNRMGYDAGEFTPVAPRVKQALGVDNYNPYTVGGVAANLLPFARGEQALSAAATGLPRLFPNLGREAAAYGGSEAAAAGAREFMPDSPLVELAASAAGGSAAGGVGGSASRSPTVSNIVKAQGNLNLTPRARAEALKGSDTQTAESFLNQLRGQPGMTQSGFDDLVKRYQGLEPNTRMTKAEFEQRIPASQYNKIDLRSSEQTANAHLMTEAEDQVRHNLGSVYERVLDRLGVPVNNSTLSDIQDYHENILDFENLSDDMQQRLYSAGIDDTEGKYALMDIFDEERDNLVNYNYELMVDDYELGDMDMPAGGYGYKDYQRLIANPESHSDRYFELGVTHPEQSGKYKHYSERVSAEDGGGLIGHVRGTFTGEEGAGLVGGEYAKPRSMVIEEIQSDAQKTAGQSGPLRQAHGTMFKAAIQHALENGADTVYYPSAREIAGVRNKPASAYAPIYDQQIVKEGLKPLLKIPGVSSRMLGGYHEIDFTPEAKGFILKGEGQAAPGYAQGGTVRAYDPQQIENIMSSINAPRNYASGGSVLAYDPGRVDAILNQFRGAV